MDKKKINEELKDLFKGTELEDLDFEYIEAETSKELIEGMEEQINENEVIYYSNAMEYLSENDASLKESLEIADELGYSPKDINSELLATLLQQQNMREELNNLEKDIEEIYSKYEE